jgi:hypothetical protein
MATRNAVTIERVSDTSDTEFVLRFDGRPNDISAQTLLESLHGITLLVQEANREMGTGEPLDVRVRAPRPGSFLIHLVLDPGVAAAAASLFTLHNLEVAKTLVDVLVASIDIRRFLKGEKPQSVTQHGSTVTIENSNGNTIIQDNRVYNFIVNNVAANSGLDRAFAALQADSSISGFEVLDRDEKKLTSVPREEFDDMSSAGSLLGGDKRGLIVRTRLSIVKLSFEPKLKWEFVYNGIKIAALIDDPGFYARVDARRESFAKGDVLDVDVRIQQEYDEKTRAFMNRGYVVTVVHDHIAIDEQRRLVTQDTPPLKMLQARKKKKPKQLKE